WKGTSSATRWTGTSRSGIPRWLSTPTARWSRRAARRPRSSTATSSKDSAPSATSIERGLSTWGDRRVSAHREAPAEPERRFGEREVLALDKHAAVSVEIVAAQLETQEGDPAQEEADPAPEPQDLVGLAAEEGGGIAHVHQPDSGRDVRHDTVRREVEDIGDLQVGDVGPLSGE